MPQDQIESRPSFPFLDHVLKRFITTLYKKLPESFSPHFPMLNPTLCEKLLVVPNWITRKEVPSFPRLVARSIDFVVVMRYAIMLRATCTICSILEQTRFSFQFA